MDAFTECLILLQLAHSLIIVIIKTKLEHSGRYEDCILDLYLNLLFLIVLCPKFSLVNLITQRRRKPMSSIYFLEICFLLVRTLMKEP